MQIALTFVLMMGGWLFFRETNPAYLFRFLRLSPFEAPPRNARSPSTCSMSVARLAAPADPRRPGGACGASAARTGGRRRSWPARYPRLAAEMVAVGGLFTLILVLRSRISFDFIYFQF